MPWHNSLHYVKQSLSRKLKQTENVPPALSLILCQSTFEVLDSCSFKKTYSNCSKMVETNLTGEGIYKTFEQLYCSKELAAGKVKNNLIILCVINIFLSITASLGNTLILVALRKETSLHPPSKLLYRNLAITDLCVGIIVEPVAVCYWTSEAMERWDICRHVNVSTYVIGFIPCSVSLMTVTALSVDRLLALLLGLRYRQVVTLKRSYAIITILWASATVAGTIYVVHPFVTRWIGNVAIILCLITSIFSYSTIFFTLRNNQIKPQEHVSQAQSPQAIPLNMARYRKAVSSALWVEITLVVCYLPYVVAVLLTPKRELSLPHYLARQFGATVMHLNSSLNPMLYCWKIKEVRQVVKGTLRHIFRSFV